MRWAGRWQAADSGHDSGQLMARGRRVRDDKHENSKSENSKSENGEFENGEFET
jgi:hypothetical protein